MSLGIGPDNWFGLVSQLEVVEGIPQMDPVSVVQSARKKGERTSDGTPLTGLSFYTGNGCAYGLDGNGDVYLYLTNPADNPGLKKPAEFARQLKEQVNYFLSLEESHSLMEKVKANDGSVLAVNLSELEKDGKLKKYSPEFSGIEVKTGTLKAGKEAVLGEYGKVVSGLIDRLHGDAIYGEDGIGVSLFAENIAETVVSILTPQYVKDKLEGRENGSMLARASKLNGFDYLSNVNLDGWNLDGLRRARGVVKETAEGGAQIIVPYNEAVQ